ncbi:hypothetical protein C2845_PM13G22630 [Panicum miliaceum]|uniref:Uncharacterized protein n=1 Tax=Panicum miliaceum TaxID=4540 RepID=A0A3L6RH61_PANMI|nr:hypothetical protein C2845_PM13G22630 [Panicum miliaceum]
MIPFQGTMMPTHHTGESSSHDPRAVNQHRAGDAPFPGELDLPPPPVPLLTHAGAGHGSSSSAAPTSTALPPFDGDCYARDTVAGVDPPVFVDPASCPEALAVVSPGTFFGLDDDYVHAARVRHPDASGVRFDDLPPETFDFFGPPHLPPPSSPTAGLLS